MFMANLLPVIALTLSLIFVLRLLVDMGVDEILNYRRPHARQDGNLHAVGQLLAKLRLQGPHLLLPLVDLCLNVPQVVQLDGARHLA